MGNQSSTVQFWPAAAMCPQCHSSKYYFAKPKSKELSSSVGPAAWSQSSICVQPGMLASVNNFICGDCGYIDNFITSGKEVEFVKAHWRMSRKHNHCSRCNKDSCVFAVKKGKTTQFLHNAHALNQIPIQYDFHHRRTAVIKNYVCTECGHIETWMNQKSTAIIKELKGWELDREHLDQRQQNNTQTTGASLGMCKFCSSNELYIGKKVGWKFGKGFSNTVVLGPMKIAPLNNQVCMECCHIQSFLPNKHRQMLMASRRWVPVAQVSDILASYQQNSATNVLASANNTSNGITSTSTTTSTPNTQFTSAQANFSEARTSREGGEHYKTKTVNSKSAQKPTTATISKKKAPKEKKAFSSKRRPLSILGDNSYDSLQSV